MKITEAIEKAKERNMWLLPLDAGVKECIVRYETSDKNRLVCDETSFDLNVNNAENELNELWEDQWNRELNASSIDSVNCVYINRRPSNV